MIDTHTHLYMPEYDGDRDEVMRRAAEARVEMMIMPNVDLTTIEPMHKLGKLYPDSVRLAMGFHPEEVRGDWHEKVAITDTWLDQGGYVAVGEIGIDLYWDTTFESEQMQAFEHQVAKAKTLDLPIIVHCRNALPQVMEVLEGHRASRGVMHCWGGTPQEVEEVRGRLDDHWYFGIGGVVTFKNSSLRQCLPAIGLNRLLLETDAPYLAPVPHRGRRNESAYVADVLTHIATHLQLSPSEVETATTGNARELFGLPVA